MFHTKFYCPIMLYRNSNSYCCWEYFNFLNQYTENLRRVRNTFIDTKDDFINTSENDICRKLDDNNDDLIEDLNDARYLDAFRAPKTDINRIIQSLPNDDPYVYNELANYGVSRGTCNYLFRLVIGYVIDNNKNYPGDQNQTVNNLLKDFEHRYPFILSSLINIPYNILNKILSRVSIFTLNNLTEVVAV